MGEKKRKHIPTRKTVSLGKRLDYQDLNGIHFIWQYIEGALVMALDFEMFRYCQKHDLIESDIIQQIDGKLKGDEGEPDSVRVVITVHCDMDYEDVIREKFEESTFVKWVALKHELVLIPKAEWKIPEEETFKGEMKSLGYAFKRLFFGKKKEKKEDGRSDGSSGQED